jgi:hypothetical protein
MGRAEDEEPPPEDNRPMPVSHPRDPLHGITLENILHQLVRRHGWNEMGRRKAVSLTSATPLQFRAFLILHWLARSFRDKRVTTRAR